MNPLPYVAELLSLNDSKTRKAYTVRMLNDKGYVKGEAFHFYPGQRGSGGECATTHVHCVFGEFRVNQYIAEPTSLEKLQHRLTYKEQGYWYAKSWSRCGIEILGEEPNATGRTYSRKCRMIVEELKQKCKQNGVKTTGLDKRGLLHALMKI
jgi:hypothetical protein